jgi:hypothetical protein
MDEYVTIYDHSGLCYFLLLEQGHFARTSTVRSPSPIVLAGFGMLLSIPVWAYGIAGPFAFINVPAIDHPVAADAAALPAFTWQHAGATDGARNRMDFKFNVPITDHVGLAIGDDAKTRGSQHALSPASALYTDEEDKLLLSLGVIRPRAGTSPASSAINDGRSTTPTVYFGTGPGDPPIGSFRRLAVTGSLGYKFADTWSKTTPSIDAETDITAVSFNIEDRGNGALSVHDNDPDVQTQPKDLGLPALRLTPVAAFAGSSSAGSSRAIGTQHRFAAGVAYGVAGYASIAEALMQGNRPSGTNLGFVAQIHLYIGDPFADSPGKSRLHW